MNVIFLIILVFYIWRIAKASHNGLVGEIGALFNTVMITISVMFAITLIDSIINKNLIAFLVAGIILMILIIIRKIIMAIIKSIDLVTKFPIISGLNRFLGLIAGIVEATLISWVLLSAVTTWDLPLIGADVMTEITENTFVNFLYVNNKLSVITDYILTNV